MDLEKLHEKSLRKVKEPSALPSQIVMICEHIDIFEISDRLVTTTTQCAADFFVSQERHTPIDKRSCVFPQTYISETSDKSDDVLSSFANICESAHFCECC